MGIISVEQADHLFWLGRYTERVYTTIRYYSLSFDTMIDEKEDSYARYCESIDIPNVYQSKEDFTKRYPFDETLPDSIISNLNRAYDNAIVLRESIGSEALSYIQMSIYAMHKAAKSAAPLIEMQQILDDILSFWGAVDDEIDSEQIRNIIKAGKRIERIDLYARLEAGKKSIERELKRAVPRILRSGIPFSEEMLNQLMILIQNEEMDYPGIISSVEAIIV